MFFKLRPATVEGKVEKILTNEDCRKSRVILIRIDNGELVQVFELFTEGDDFFSEFEIIGKRIMIIEGEIINVWKI